MSIIDIFLWLLLILILFIVVFNFFVYGRDIAVFPKIKNVYKDDIYFDYESDYEPGYESYYESNDL